MQTAQSEDWRPGFAKRAENFSDVCAQAQRWRWSPGQSIARVAAAVLKGTPTLTIPQRMTLLLYVEHLNQDRLEQNIASVWPSTHLVARYLGCSESQARANRGALEAAGFLVRDYTKANRPAGAQAYDLRPLMARLEELEGADTSLRQEMEARRAAYSDNVVFAPKYSAQVPKSRRLEQPQKNFSLSVQENEAAKPKTNRTQTPATPHITDKRGDKLPKRPENRNLGPIGSSERARGFGSTISDPVQYTEMVRQELKTAALVCARIAALVTPALLANPLNVAPEAAAGVAAAAAEFLPNPERNNDQTAMWGWRKHGIRVLVMLAIALEDPEIHNPCGYFGRLAGQDRGAADLRLNLARILKGQGSTPPPAEVVLDAPETEPAPLMFAPGTEDQPWPQIAGHLRTIVREGVWGSWFSRVGFHGISDGVLLLSVPLELAADRIKRDYLPAILQATAAADVFVERVVLTVRKR